jgi:hypothetical protein
MARGLPPPGHRSAPGLFTLHLFVRYFPARISYRHDRTRAATGVRCGASDQAHTASSIQALGSRHVHVVIHSMPCEFLCRLRSVSEPPYCIAFACRNVEIARVAIVQAARLHWSSLPRLLRLGLAAPKRRGFPGLGVVATRRNRCRFATGDTSCPMSRNDTLSGKRRGAGCCDSQHHPCILSILRR